MVREFLVIERVKCPECNNGGWPCRRCQASGHVEVRVPLSEALAEMKRDGRIALPDDTAVMFFATGSRP